MKLLKKLANLLVESYAPDAAREATITELLRVNRELRERHREQLDGASSALAKAEAKFGDCKIQLAMALHRAKDAEIMRDAYGMELDRIKCRRTVILTSPHDPVSTNQALLAIAVAERSYAPSSQPTHSPGE